MNKRQEWQTALLKWYDAHRRDLPWRDTRDAYRIWVSEIILQQTRVEQGLAYYHRFLEAFPTVEALASAPEDDVMRVWQGLGYYSRARNMQAAARQVVEAGRFPDTYEEVRKLKGVGDYTAAAICSFAYGLPCAVVDGNVYRVLSRYFADDTPIDTTQGKRLFADLAQMLLPEASLVADYNQALMDFGAMQCTPQTPRCDDCPLAYGCAARAAKRVGDYPVKTHRTSVTERHFVYIIVCVDDDVLLHRRGKGDIWQGLYEFPLIEFDHTPTERQITSIPWVKQALKQGAEMTLIAKRMKHLLTHRTLWADAYVLVVDTMPDIPIEGLIRVPLDDLPDYAMPRLVEIIAGRAELIE